MTLPLLALALWGLGFLVIFRIPLCKCPGEHVPCPNVSIIVPARNEEHNLPRLLESIARQDLQPAEVIVVDDASTDRTAAIARESNARLLRPGDLPEGWRGKPWACLRGAEAAKGDVLLFVDADTFFEEGGMRRIMDTYLAAPGVLSLGPYHKVECVYEELSAYFNIVMTAATAAFTIRGARRAPAGLFGPFLMIDRQTYFLIGGHASVKDKILENYHLATQLQGAGVPLRCLGGKGAFGMRMYPNGPRELIHGWSKAFAAGAAQTPVDILLMVIGWMAAGVLVTMHLGWSVSGGSASALALAGALYALYAAQVWSILIRIGAFRIWTALFYPIPLLFYFGVFGRSMWLAARGREIRWKGRTMITPPPGK